MTHLANFKAVYLISVSGALAAHLFNNNAFSCLPLLLTSSTRTPRDHISNKDTCPLLLFLVPMLASAEPRKEVLSDESLESSERASHADIGASRQSEECRQRPISGCVCKAGCQEL